MHANALGNLAVGDRELQPRVARLRDLAVRACRPHHEDAFRWILDPESESFGNRRHAEGRRTRAQRGADLRYDLAIAFEEAVFGLETKVKIPRAEMCSNCRGTGAKKGSEPVSCAPRILDIETNGMEAHGGVHRYN